MDVAGTDVAGTDVAGMAVYLDSCIVIYLVEEHPICAAPIQQTLAAAGNVVYASRRWLNSNAW